MGETTMGTLIGGPISLMQNTGECGARGTKTLGHTDRGTDQPHTEHRREGSKDNTYTRTKL